MGISDSTLFKYRQTVISSVWLNDVNYRIFGSGVVDAGLFGVKADGVTDDSAAMSAALSYVANYGGELRLPGTSTILINNPLVATTTVPLGPVLGVDYRLYLSPMRTFRITSPGRCTILAGASMGTMLTVEFSSGNIAPFFVEVDGILFNANSLATNCLFFNYSTKSHVRRCTFANMNGGFGLSNTGYGVAEWEYNTFINGTTQSTGILINGGGDTYISHNDFYSANNSNGNVGITMQQFSGDTHIENNIFSSSGSAVDDIGIYLEGNVAGQGGEIRDVTIQNNEFASYTTAIYGVAASSNVYNCIVSHNHMTEPLSGKTAGIFLSLTGALNFLIEGNILGEQSYATFTGNMIALTNCGQMKVRDNKIWNTSLTPFVYTNVVDTVTESNEFYNYGQAANTNPAIGLFSTCENNVFRGNVYNQSSSSYGQYAIAENTGCNFNFAQHETYTGIAQPYLVVGSGTVFNREEWNPTGPSGGTGYYNPGDIIHNTAATAAKNISHWVCSTAGTPGGWASHGCGSGPTGSRPSLGVNDFGYLYRDTTTGTIVFWNGSAFI